MGVEIQYEERGDTFLSRLGAKSRKMPILKNWAAEIRAIFILAISIFSIIVVIGVMVVLINAPRVEERLKIQ